MAVKLETIGQWYYVGKSNYYYNSSSGVRMQLFVFSKLNSIGETSANITTIFTIALNTSFRSYNGSRQIKFTRTSPSVNITDSKNTFSDSDISGIPGYTGDLWNYNNSKWYYTNVEPANISSNSSFSSIDNFINNAATILEATHNFDYNSDGEFSDLTIAASISYTASNAPSSPWSITSDTITLNTIDVGVKLSIKTSDGWQKSKGTWVKTSDGWQKAKGIWVKTSDGWKKAK